MQGGAGRGWQRYPRPTERWCALVCAGCATDNEPGRKFCRACGRRLAVACPACQAPNAADDRFCGECGAPLTAAQARPAEQGTGQPASATTERRLVSVLFADLVGSTPFAEGRDPEDVRAMLSEYFDTASEAIQRHGGVVEKFIGDAVMAVWGTPVAHEDDAERAVRAALEVIGGVHGLGPGVRARVGVVTGEAANDLGHPRPVVTALVDQQTVVHDLYGPTVADLDLARILHLVNAVGIPARNRHQHSAGGSFVESGDIGLHKPFIHRRIPFSHGPGSIRRDLPANVRRN